ncbi:toxin VasX [Tenacibaculum mesophilum]|uniref:toxin VasX n=1 Tax=Tenacibaculum mesophilum TaxID=104268 RepID=UPI0006498E58|nr:toxin VasX [Tenacibaculum mesophilum]
MANDILEKNQLTEYNEVVARYFFECTGGGVTEPVKSPEKEALKPGIRLHFLRYGLFDRNSENQTEEDVNAPKYNDPRITKGVLLQEGKAVCKNVATCNSNTQNTNTAENSTLELEEVEVLSLKELPQINNFYVARTALNKGYIYLINDEDQDDYHELYVDESGQLQHIIWAYNKDEKGNYKDIRKPSGDKSEYKLIIEPGKKYWVAYSPVQWSRDYHNELNTDANKRKERMKLIDCSGIKKGEEEKHENVIPFTNVRATFPGNHPRAGALEKMLDSILSDEKKQDEKGDNEVFEDMFVTLHDPVGCANDVGVELADKIADLEALVESLGTGKDPVEIKKDILEGKPKQEIKKGSREEQISTLLATALTTYQLVYNDKEMITDYDGGESGSGPKFTGINIGATPMIYWDGNGILQQKLIDILAVKERKKIRESIVSYRHDFTIILGSDYYTQYFEDFNENGFIGLLEGKHITTSHMRLLSIAPGGIDHYLDLKKHRDNYKGELKNKNKEAKEFYIKYVKGSNKKVHEVLEKELNLDFFDENENVLNNSLLTDLANKVAGHVSNGLEAYVGLSNAKKINLNLTFDRLKVLTHKGKPVFQTRTRTLEALLKQNGATLDESVKLVDFKKGHRIAKILDVEEIYLVNEYNPKGKNTLNVPAKIPAKKTKAQVQGAQRVLNNIHFAKGLYYLQILNISSATYQVYDSPSAKSLVNLVGIGTELTGAFFNVKRVNAIALNRESKVVSSLSNRARLFNKVGAGFTAAVCFWEAIDAFSDNDNDAAFMWVGAGALFTTGIFVSGPVGWVIGGVAIGLVYLANYFKDTPLERYFKHYWLSDRVALSRNNNETPWQYINRVYENRSALIKDREEYKDWKDLRVCHQQLLDLMVCSAMFVKEIKLSSERVISIGGEDGRAGASFATSDVSKLTIQTSFRQFLWFKDQLQYKVFLVNTRTGSYEEIAEEELRGEVNLEEDNKGKIIATNTTINIPNRVHRKRHNNQTTIFQLLFICKLTIDEETNKYYPHTYVGEERYMGIKIKLFESKVTGTKNMDGLLFKPQPTEYKGFYYKNVKVDTLNNLLVWAKDLILNI